jgi:anthranilate synthase/aminodeoxychorismate synthase-like glutamine amidotransferase
MTGTRVRPAAPGTNVVLVDHDDSYTWNLVHLIAEVTGQLPTVVHHRRVHAEDLLATPYTHIVLSPGPGSPMRRADFGVGADLLRRSDRPTLGVCLGMQGLVAAWGGTVAPIAPAHGVLAWVHHRRDRLFTGMPNPFRAVRYHSLGAIGLGPQIRETAWCLDDDGGRVVMAVAHRRRPLWGVQFHPESIASTCGPRLLANFLCA